MPGHPLGQLIWGNCMCRAVEKLTPEQKRVFETLREQLEGTSPQQQIPIVEALKEHIALSIFMRRPYDLPHPPVFPPSE